MGKIVINKTDAGQKVLLDTNEEGVTGGYYDRQDVWHEFGGVGSSLQPVVHFTLINEGGENQFAIKELRTRDVVADGHFINMVERHEVIPVNGVYSWDCLCAVEIDPETSIGTALTHEPVIRETDYSGDPNSLIYNFIVRSADNCSYDADINQINVTDITKEASIELVTQYTIEKTEG